jgi:trans-aconitate 2-methyltransferase
MQYAFGDSDIAARRLELLAAVFASSSRPFLLRAAGDNPRLVVDLGCGPGHSTRFLADVLPCEHVAGLDNSEHFLARARQTPTEKLSFHLHDVTAVPFPVEPADLLYGRFLLTHLPEPQSVVARWATQLRPGGLLLLEETEWIHTRHGLFATYLEIVEALLASQGNDLYIGGALESLTDSAALRRRSSELARLPVSNRDTAALFFLNIQSWKHRPFIRTNYPAAMIEQLEAGLEALAQGSSGEAEIEFGLRQIVWERP